MYTGNSVINQQDSIPSTNTSCKIYNYYRDSSGFLCGKISKNHNGNLYLYSDDSLQSPYLSSQFYQEIFLTTHNDKLFIAISICVEKCNGSTDFLNIIKPSN